MKPPYPTLVIRSSVGCRNKYCGVNLEPVNRFSPGAQNSNILAEIKKKSGVTAQRQVAIYSLNQTPLYYTATKISRPL